MIKAVVLDLDDTLCLTEEACYALENKTLVAMGRSAMSREVHLRTWGKPLFQVITERSPGIDVAAFRVAYTPFIKEAIASGDLDKIPDENLEVVDNLVLSGIAVVILTSREHAELEHILGTDHILNGRVEAFYYKDNMQYHKPDPRAFEHIEREHGWLPEECVYVGDSIGDAAAATGAHLHFVASLESGLRTMKDFDGYPVAAFIHKFTELPDAITALQTR